MLLRHLHEHRVEFDGGEPIVLPVPRDHGLRRAGIEFGAGGREIAIEARLLRVGLFCRASLCQD